MSDHIYGDQLDQESALTETNDNQSKTYSSYPVVTAAIDAISDLIAQELSNRDDSFIVRAWINGLTYEAADHDGQRRVMDDLEAKLSQRLQHGDPNCPSIAVMALSWEADKPNSAQVRIEVKRLR